MFDWRIIVGISVFGVLAMDLIAYLGMMALSSDGYIVGAYS